MGQGTDPSNVTRILNDAASGKRAALDELLPHIYAEMRAVAQKALNAERSDHTLQATALVHEAYMKLVDQRNMNYAGRREFFAAAASVIRRILIDHARTKKRAKRGGAKRALSLDGAIDVGDPDQAADLVDLNDALTKLGEMSPRAAKVVELRFFGGLTMDEIAEVLDVSPRTAADDWTTARAWLKVELGKDQGESAK